jgi:Zn-finger nucleic acid-binding protein
MTSRQDIEIDYCPECRGVWLDRGELDKLIEKAMTAAGPQATPIPAQPQPQQQPFYYKKSDDDYYKDKHYYKKRKSFLSEIFD